MTKRLKDILLAIAQLPMTDQRWILKCLPHEQRIKMERLHGLQYLHEARRFKGLSTPTRLPLKSPPPLPEGCEWLAKQDPLYIATVLEQAAFAWKNDFLQQYDQEGIIYASIEGNAPHLKPLIKQMICMDWEKNTSFEQYLEDPNG